MLVNCSQEDDELEKVGDFTLLPDGSLQPQNLYLEITKTLKEHSDDLGFVIIRKFFTANGKGVKPIIGRTVCAALASADNILQIPDNATSK